MATNKSQIQIFAVSFAAVSSKKQVDKVSIPDQHKGNRQKIDELGGTLVAELTIPGESRGEGGGIYTLQDAISQPKGRGAAYKRLVSMAEAGEMNLIVFRSSDRMARSSEFANALFGFLMRHGVALYDREMPPHTLDPKEQYEDIGLMINRAIGAARSHREVIEIKRKNREGMEGIIRKGRPPGRLIDGYEYKDGIKRYEDGNWGEIVSNHRIEFIKIGFQMILSGESSVDVESYFNRIGFAKVQGNKWPEDGSIWRRYMLNCWKYAGYVEYNKQVKESEAGLREFIRVKGRHPAIITEKEARKLDKIREDNQHAPAAKRLFAGVVRCRNCNRSMQSMNNGAETNTYRCSRQGGGCGRSRSEKLLKADFLNACNQLKDSRIVDEIVGNAGYDSAPVDRMAMLQGQLETIQGKRDRATNLYVDNLMSRPDLEKQLERIDEEESGIIADMAEISMPKKTPDEIRTMLADFSARGPEHMEGDVKVANSYMKGFVTMWVDFDNGRTVDVQFG